MTCTAEEMEQMQRAVYSEVINIMGEMEAAGHVASYGWEKLKERLRKALD